MSENVYTKLSVETHTTPNCPITPLGEAFNPFTDPYISDPYAFFARIRREEAVFYSPEIDHWVVSLYKDVKTILQDTKTYSARMAQSPIKPWPETAVDLLNAQNFKLIPNLIPNACEELLRYDSSVITWRRVAKKDVTIHCSSWANFFVGGMGCLKVTKSPVSGHSKSRNYQG